MSNVPENLSVFLISPNARANAIERLKEKIASGEDDPALEIYKSKLKILEAMG